jgi:hypothetical protein
MGKFITAAIQLLVCALALGPPATAATAMSFELVTLGDGRCGANCPRVISAQGEIGDETPDALLGFLGDHLRGGGVRSTMLLDSPGGKVVASMEFGQTLRRLGMAVIVARPTTETASTGDLAAGQCYSACVYALMGGRKRVIPPQSRIGIHRMYAYTSNFSLPDMGMVSERNLDDGWMRDMLARYSKSMGVSVDLVNLAERTSPDQLHILSAAEIARWRLGSRKP